MPGALVIASRMQRAATPGSGFKPVEPGVTGAEKLFQENRNFGPGPISPYPNSRPPRPVSRARMNNGVYYGSGAERPRRA